MVITRLWTRSPWEQGHAEWCLLLSCCHPASVRADGAIGRRVILGNAITRGRASRYRDLAQTAGAQQEDPPWSIGGGGIRMPWPLVSSPIPVAVRAIGAGRPDDCSGNSTKEYLCATSDHH